MMNDTAAFLVASTFTCLGVAMSPRFMKDLSAAATCRTERQHVQQHAKYGTNTFMYSNAKHVA